MLPHTGTVIRSITVSRTSDRQYAASPGTWGALKIGTILVANGCSRSSEPESAYF
jgi:hypothetical protein